ncbi:unnamed protein product [Durusdinium trenchii]|uniref:J domain-containing protein n=1 Tax=Durusdinium trenchii TaxID=1381693 RepID=A0ABP0PFV7_9DINO
MASSAPIDFASGDHYTVLGVARNASEAELAKAYKMLALRYHPDKNQGNTQDAEIGFKRISEAYSVLRDPEKRAEYDRSGGIRSYVSYEEAEQLWRQFSSQDGTEAPSQEEASRRRKATALVVVFALLFLAPNLLMQILPGLAAALVGLALISRTESASRWVWLALGLVLAGYLVPWVLRVRSEFEPVRGANLRGLGEPSPVPVGTPESGEEVLLNDGRFMRLPDPENRKSAERSAKEGWQQRLLSEMTTAIKGGHEQVLTVFSRQGCPWCQRQLPVLQRAIAKRVGHSAANNDAAREAPPSASGQHEQAETPQEVPAQAFVSTAAVGLAKPPSGASLVSAPLRVFILYAEEFPSAAQAFNVEAFPTLIAWGLPGVPPLAAQGYLDDESLEQLLTTVALSEPQSD